MPDEITAQKLLQEWATGRGFATTLTDKKLYFHYDKYNGFAILDFSKSPAVQLEISTHPDYHVRLAFWAATPDWGNPQPKKIYESYDLNLADEKVLTKIERILDRTINSYLDEG